MTYLHCTAPRACDRTVLDNGTVCCWGCGVVWEPPPAPRLTWPGLLVLLAIMSVCFLVGHTLLPLAWAILTGSR